MRSLNAHGDLMEPRPNFFHLVSLYYNWQHFKKPIMKPHLRLNVVAQTKCGI